MPGQRDGLLPTKVAHPVKLTQSEIEDKMAPD